MKVMKILLSLCFFLAFCLGGAVAQQALPAAGGEASGSGGSASYTLGQLSYTAKTVSGGMVSTGVQQTYEVSVVSGMEEGSGIHLHLAAYPNPVAAQLTIEVDMPTAKGRKLSYHLYDLNGRLLQQQEISGTKTELRVEELAPATYILKVNAGNKELKTFRILKK